MFSLEELLKLEANKSDVFSCLCGKHVEFDKFETSNAKCIEDEKLSNSVKNELFNILNSLILEFRNRLELNFNFVCGIDDHFKLNSSKIFYYQVDKQSKIPILKDKFYIKISDYRNFPDQIRSSFFKKILLDQINLKLNDLDKDKLGYQEKYLFLLFTLICDPGRKPTQKYVFDRDSEEFIYFEFSVEGINYPKFEVIKSE